MDFNALCKDKNHRVLQTLVIYDSSSLISDPDQLQKPNFGRHLVKPVSSLSSVHINNKIRITSNVLTYSAVNSCVPTGMQ